MSLTTLEALDAYESVRHRLPAPTRGGDCTCLANLDDLADRFDVFLLDAFGVLNIGETAIAGVPDRVRRLQAAGKRVLVVTNAASYPHAGLISKYSRLGYEFAAEDVISSRATLLRAVAAMSDTRWGVMAPAAHGPNEFAHLNTTFLGDDPVPYDVVDGFLMIGSADWNDQRQTMLEVSLTKNPRRVLVGNPDIVAPRETGFTLEPGYYAHRLADRTDAEPEFFGKPFGNIYDLVFDHLDRRYERSRIVMVGDSLHTDILGGQNAGIRTALIRNHGFFSGTDVEAAIATTGIAPDFILDAP